MQTNKTDLYKLKYSVIIVFILCSFFNSLEAQKVNYTKNIVGISGNIKGIITKEELIKSGGLSLDNHLVKKYQISSFRMKLLVNNEPDIVLTNAENGMLTDAMKSVINTAPERSRIEFDDIYQKNLDSDSVLRIPITLRFKIMAQSLISCDCDTSFIGKKIRFTDNVFIVVDHDETFLKKLNKTTGEEILDSGRDTIIDTTIRSIFMNRVHWLNRETVVELEYQHTTSLDDNNDTCVYFVYPLNINSVSNGGVAFIIDHKGKYLNMFEGEYDEKTLQRLLGYFK